MSHAGILGGPWSGKFTLRRWGILALVAATLILIGPYGTFIELSLPLRALYWGVLVAGAAMLEDVAIWAIRRWLMRPGWSPLAARLAAALLSAVPVAAAAALLHRWLTGQLNLPPYPEIYLYTATLMAVVTVTLGFVAHAPDRRPAAPDASAHGPDPSVAAAEGPASAPAAGPDETPAFLRRAVPGLAGATLLALEAEDHYLRVHTDKGSELVLMRLRDAVDALPPHSGLQVHRSFWVSGTAVTGVVRRGPAAQLTLRNGMTVPVGRTYLPALREAAWLDRDFAADGGSVSG